MKHFPNATDREGLRDWALAESKKTRDRVYLVGFSGSRYGVFFEAFGADSLMTRFAPVIVATFHRGMEVG